MKTKQKQHNEQQTKLQKRHNKIGKYKTHKNLYLKTKYDNYKIVVLEDISKENARYYINLIASQNQQTPIYGYLSLPTLLRELKPKTTFMIFKRNLFIGVIFFKNMTYDFKKSLLGEKYINDKELKSKADVNSYIVNWVFIDDKLEKELFNMVIDKFRKINNLMIRNIIIIAMKYLDFEEDSKLLIKYKSMINYKLSNEYQHLIHLGFKYNGYDLTMDNKLTNLFSIRFINKLTKDDFFPTYIFTRQFKTEVYINYSNIEKNLFQDGLLTINNMKRYSIDSTVLYYTYNIYSGIESIYSVPYNFNFIVNYITNSLGNSHIIKNYCMFYYATKDIIDKENMKYLIPIIDSYDEVLKIFDKKNPKILLANYDITPIQSYFGIGFNNKELFIEYNARNQNKVLHGFWIRDFTIKILKMKDDHSYYITPYILFTYINNKLKCYMWKDIGFLIYEEKEEDFYNNKEFGLRKFFVPPLILSESFNTYSSKYLDINILLKKIRKVCALIGKIYKKHVNLAINQIHGFTSIQPAIALTDNNGIVEPVIINIRPISVISNSKNYEMSKWIYDLAISSALYSDFKCDNQELHYQPLDID